MKEQGYYRFPSIAGDLIVFVSEDDLWSVSSQGGVARRLTAGVSECSTPRLSPDGSTIAFVAREEGDPEVYCMKSEGGSAGRLTFLGSEICAVAGWSPDSQKIYLVSDARSPFLRHTELYELTPGATPRPLSLGHGLSIAVAAGGEVAIGRNNNDPARWKRYRGGTAGEIWSAPSLAAKFKNLLSLPGNIACPMWIKSRLYFLSDHEGIANIYSCRQDGSDLKKLSHQTKYYVRFPAADGKRIVYTAGAEIYLLDPASGENTRLDVRTPSSPTQAVRRFVRAADCLEHFAPHPQGHCLALIARGQPFTMPYWEESFIQHGQGSRIRYRLCEWLGDGKCFVVVSDKNQQQSLEIHLNDQSAPPESVTTSDIGRPIELSPSPCGRFIAVSNHRHELLLVDRQEKRTACLDRAPGDRIAGLAWSPDSRWLAYSWSQFANTSIIRIYNVADAVHHDVTRAVRQDFSPCFDPEGKYLYFLSNRDFFPVYDAQQFDLSFPAAIRPFLVTLRKDIPSPFTPAPKPFIADKSAPTSLGQNLSHSSSSSETVLAKSLSPSKSKKKADSASPDKGKGGLCEGATTCNVGIDFDGIGDRLLSFPVDEGIYRQIAAVKGRVLVTLFKPQPIRRDFNWFDEDSLTGSLVAYDFLEQRSVEVLRGVSGIRLSGDHRTLVYRLKDRLRVIDALDKLPENSPPVPPAEISRKGGWIDLGRVSVMIEPTKEWEQMFHEAWRLQREHFWDESMSKVDWDLVLERYLPLLKKVKARTELSDLIWEMQGELGTSHAYEMGGDHRRPRLYYRGFLGAELSFDRRSGGWRIDKILRGDSWDRQADSPLAEPGLNILPKEVIVGVCGRRTDKDCSPEELLVNAAGKNVTLELLAEDGGRRLISVQTLKDEKPLRYRQWVEGNRKYVLESSDGRVGYLHIPDMGPAGFAEFHRSYLLEINREALIVDVRYNRGGHVSPLLLEKLLRRRVGYDVSRWGIPQPYPPESVAGPMVALTNQFAGSDGDIFSHCFKLYKLGPLVGKRTWGGVIGIWPRHRLVDGTIVTQPEFSFWFSDVGFSVENYGTDPDFDVDIAPHDYRAQRDRQMEKALELILETLSKQPVSLPPFGQRPARSLPSTRGKSSSKRR